MVGITAKVEDREVIEFLNQLPETLFKNVRRTFGQAVIDAQKEVIGNFNHTGAIGDNKLTSRTGLLAKSIRTSLSGSNLANVNASVHSDVIYAPIQETGGTVTAKNAYRNVPGGPYLNIPLPANKTPAGVMRKTARDVFNEGGFIIKSKAGNWLVLSVNGQAMFVLKKSIKVKPRLGMFDAVQKQVPVFLKAIQELSLEK